MKKAQSAIEYLMTYGWMLLVVAVVGGAVFSVVGGQNIESVSGFNSNNIVLDAGTTPSSLQLNLEAFGPNSITLKQVKLSDSGSNISIPLNSEINAGDNQILNLAHVTESSENNELDVELVYNSGGLENMTVSGTITGNLELEKNLVGYWTLSNHQANNMQNKIYDISKNDKSGDIDGAQFKSDEDLGRVMEFELNDSVSVNLDHLNFNESFTAAGWIKTFDQDYDGAITYKSSYTNNPGWAIAEGQTMVEDDIGHEEGNRVRWRGSYLPENEFVFTALVVDRQNGVAEFFVDGSSQGEKDISHLESISYDDNLLLGKWGYGQDGYRFTGQISEVRLYDRVLSEKEVSSIYANKGLVN